MGAIAAGLTLVATIVAPSARVPNVTDVPVAYAASVDFYLKIDGVDGESRDAMHKGEIDIQSFS